MDQICTQLCELNNMKPKQKNPQSLKKPQKAVNRQNILSPNQQKFIPSIIDHTFQNDTTIIKISKQNQQRKNLRHQLMNNYLVLNANQYVFFNAFYYLESYLNRKQGQIINTTNLIISCLALARKYQKGKFPDYKCWQEKLGLILKIQQITQKVDQIIQVLQFQLQPTTRFNFYSDLLLSIQLSQKVQHFCSYLLDLSVFLTHFQIIPGQPGLQYTQAEIGLSVIRLACYYFSSDQLDKIPIVKYGYNIQRIHECCTFLFKLLMTKKLNGVKQIRHRYKRTKFMQVAKIQFVKLPKSRKQKQNATQQSQLQQTS